MRGGAVAPSPLRPKQKNNVQCKTTHTSRHILARRLPCHCDVHTVCPLPPKRSFILHGRFLYKWQLLLYAISLLHSAFFLFCLVFNVQKLRNNEMLMHMHYYRIFAQQVHFLRSIAHATSDIACTL